MILERDWRERNINLLFYLCMHSLVDSCMCPDRVWNPQRWCIGTTLSPAELPGQGLSCPSLSTLSSVIFWSLSNHSNVLSLCGLIYVFCCSYQFSFRVSCFFVCLIIFDYGWDGYYIWKKVFRNNLKLWMTVHSFRKDIACYQICWLLPGD